MVGWIHSVNTTTSTTSSERKKSFRMNLLMLCECEKSEKRDEGNSIGLEGGGKEDESERNNVSFPFVCCLFAQLFSISFLLKRSPLKKESSHKHHFTLNHLLAS